MLASLFFRRYNFGLYNLNLYCYCCHCCWKHCLFCCWPTVTGVPAVLASLLLLVSMLLLEFMLLLAFLLWLLYLLVWHPCSCWCHFCCPYPIWLVSVLLFLAGVPRPCCGWCTPPCCGWRPFVPAASGIPAVAGVLAVSHYGPLSVITIRIPVSDNQK
jgi:hypothetical protein